MILSRRFLVRGLRSTGVLFNDCLGTASSVSVFRPGSTSPSAILFDAWESFDRRSPKADESIRSIRTELAAAVDECIQAAGMEWESTWQRRLLNVCCRSLLRQSGDAHFDYRRPLNLVAVIWTFTIPQIS